MLAGCRLWHSAPLNLLAPAANTMHGSETMLRDADEATSPDLGSVSSWLCFVSLVGHLLCSTSHFLGSPFQPNPCCGTSWAQELPQLYPHLSHFSITAPSSHLDACANPEGKGHQHPMGQPLTIGRWELVEKMPHSFMSRGTILRCIPPSS